MAAQTLIYTPGEFLFKEGEPSDSLYVIQTGTVAIRKMKGSSFVDIAKIYQSEILGELSFFDKDRRSASAIAITEVQALKVEFESLEKIYAGVPSYFRTIMAAMAERLRKADEQIRRLQTKVVDANEGVVGKNAVAKGEEVDNDDESLSLEEVKAMNESLVKDPETSESDDDSGSTEEDA